MSQPGTAVRRSRNTLRNDAGHLPPRVLSRSLGLVNVLAALLSIALLATPRTALAARYTLIGWNNLGMHCMDGDYSVLSLLPPYNTIHAQLVSPTGALIDDPAAAGITVTYRAVADPSGSINTTSLNKTNFWMHVDELFGASLSVNAGLAGFDMPGAAGRGAGRRPRGDSRRPCSAGSSPRARCPSPTVPADAERA